MPILTRAHREHFNEHGYMVVDDAVPIDLCDAVVAAIWAFMEIDPTDPDDWYRLPHKPPERPGVGMVGMYWHQAMWNVYQHPRIHQIYSEVYGTHRLWVHIDRVNMKPPRHPDYPEWVRGSRYHWDADTSKLPVRFGTQGVLYLTDTDADQGSFVCWPGAHKSLIDEEHPSIPELTPDKFVPIPANGGSMLIWHQALPHGNGVNTSDKPRFAQYMNYYPAPAPMNQKRREERITLWKERRALGEGPYTLDPRGWEAVNYGPPDLTWLGRRLLGLDLWDRSAPGNLS